MLFESYTTALWYMVGTSFVAALILGAVANKTNFCTMGAVSDWVNMGDTGRFRSWMFAITVALIGALIIEGAGLVDLDSTFPGYRSGNFIWLENIIGGAMFGIGMSLASGCTTKNLVRLGGGNLKSLVVLAIVGIAAYFMIFPFPGTDMTLMNIFMPLLGWSRVSLDGGQDLGSLIAGGDAAMTGRMVIGIIVAAAFLLFVVRSTDFRHSSDNILGGLVVGLVVTAGWYFSGSIQVQGSFEATSLASFAGDWSMNDPGEGAVQPVRSAFVDTQSYTFVNPTAQAVGWVGSGFSGAFLTFGLAAFFGVIVGSFLYALASGNFRKEWFASKGDFANHAIGAVLMGIGGVMALGCTIGQGVTGFSTLSLGSILTFISIVIGAATTMKIQYYKMVYEEEATFGKALVTAFVDLKLLPPGLRKLEAI
ncbi:MAG: YeeE/YedE family protein [Thiohalospira sp.]